MTKMVLDWGIDVVLWLQQFSPALDLPFTGLTLLGGRTFFMLVIPLMYWSIDRRIGVRLAILFLVSTYVNGAAKAIVAQPRPHEYDWHVQPLFPTTGGGLPSGHTQNAVVVWSFLATCIRRRWAWWAAGLLMIFVPLSRVYLGVHFPTDLAGGYLLGAIILLGYFWIGPALERRLLATPLLACVAFTTLVAVGLLLLAPGAEEHCVDAAGTLLGMGAGFALERRYVRFTARGLWQARALRFLSGIVIMITLMLVLRWAFDGLSPANTFQFARYAMVGLWGGLGAPWMFVKLKLADRE